MIRNNDEMYWTIFIWLGLFVGSTLGSYVPILWDESLFSLSSILCAMGGGFFGILAGYKISQLMSQ